MASGFKPTRVRGLGGYLDTRSQPDEVGASQYRLLLNTSMRGRNRRCRRGGWKKLYDAVNAYYNNEDLHDQLLPLSFYYESLSETIIDPGGFTGEYQYPYSFPEQTVEASFEDTEIGDFCGYPPFDSADWPPYEGYGIETFSVGYPYSLAPFAYDDDCNTGFPHYYAGSSYTLIYRVIVPGFSIPAYVAGDPVAIYSNARTYVYEYCGTYPYDHDRCTEHVNLLTSLGNADGRRTLIAATKSRIYALNQSMGNWKIVADGLGTPPDQEEDCDTCSPERWLAGVVDNIMVLTNGVNPPIAYNALAQPTGCAVWRATEIEELATLNVLTAGCVGAWKTFMFLGDVYQDGARRRNRILWSDTSDPYTWIPADDNLAGFQDLGNDETILRIESLNDYLFIYTDKSIYRAALIQSGTIVSFAFEEIYRGEEGSLKFKYAFASTGDAHYFWAKDRLLKMTSFDKRPQEPTVLRLCSNSVFDGITRDDLTFGPLNQEACEQFVGGFNPQFREIWFSWPTDDNICPNMSLVINVTLGEEGADFVDEGFTAFHWFDGKRTSTLFEWLESLEACTREELLPDLVKEGDPYTLVSPPFTDPVNSIWNATEDTSLASDADSLCQAVADSWIREVCKECEVLSRFVMASTVDRCLKEYSDNSYYREHLDNSTYFLDGYDTVIESGVEDFGVDDEKEANALRANYTAVAQTTPNLLYAYMGYGPAPDCITWEQLKFYDDCESLTEGIELACMEDLAPEDRADQFIRPDDNAEWPTSIRGKYLGWRLKIDGTGGGSCFSRVGISISKVGS